MNKKKSKKIKDEVEGKVSNVLNILLNPLAEKYRSSRKYLIELKNKAPSVYNEVESIIKSHLVLFDKKKPSEVKVGNILTEQLASKLPRVSNFKVKNILKEEKSQSFMDLISLGFGAQTDKEKDYTKIVKRKLFKKILIANRGEIALRIIRACRELGISVEIVYTEPDKSSLAVKFADKAHLINTAKGYLDMNRIIAIAKKSKVDAIHPGYGFLAENAEFVKLCEKEKVGFVGPTSKTINMLGDKVQARRHMQNADVPVLPGTEVLKNKEQALKIANEVGYPIILKAVAGGGGKGMRIVKNDKELDKYYDQAENEAKNAFGDKSIFLEKYLQDPKHIEFQILADKFGSAVHLGERDCTIQRKHQKLIEEAPSIALTEEIRQKMGQAAVKVVSATKYRGAGTVEFLLDKNKNYYFIEMNTRIQVEHGITEMVTGVDLVKEQIKLAAGAKLTLKQEDIKIEGYAIECRINAEDPASEFLPSTGTVYNYLPPGAPGIRVSSICHTGYKVTSNFDSLLALLICNGIDRADALAKMRNALEEYIIEGVKTTIPFHRAILNHKDFIKGNVTTSFIENSKILDVVKKQDKKTKVKIPDEKKVLIVTTAVSKYMKKKKQAVSQRPSPWVIAARQESMNTQDETF